MIEMRSPEHLTISELLQEAHRETQAYLRKQSKTDACAFELFRRAIGQRDEYAWICLYELYRAVVSSWILRHQPSVQSEDLEPLVNGVFAKFSRSIRPEKLEGFTSVGALLAYLKCCAESVLADYRRSQLTRPREEPLAFLDQEPLLDDPADTVAERLATQEIWRIASREAQGREEQLVLSTICALGWSCRELQQCYPLVFPTIKDIYRVKRNLLERLRRNRQLLQLLTRQLPHQAREAHYAG